MSIPLRLDPPVPALQSVFRYLGCGTAPDPETAVLCQQLLPDFLSVLDCRACYREISLTVSGDTVIPEGLAPIPGAALAGHLRGCSRALLFAATIGSGADRQRMRAQVTSPARALVLDALGTAAIEALCDRLCQAWQQQYAPLVLRPRFSPGYGDLPLSLQGDLLGLLDSPRQAGITLTEGLMMLPHKSVSAIVGIGPEGCVAPVHDCAACSKTDCAFRR